MTARTYSLAEEVAHSGTHGIGVLASLVAIPWLAVTAVMHGDRARLVGGIAFGAAALLTFASSTVYHALQRPAPKALLRKLDHSAIYLLIAGTYTPFTIGVLRGSWGWGLAAVVWTLCACGIGAEMLSRVRRPRLSALLYLGTGWVGVVAIAQLNASLSAAQFAWVMAGGLLYTCGVPFYIWKSRAYTHLVWHVFVLAAVACHFVAVLGVMRIA